jgi:hypothetical protein
MIADPCLQETTQYLLALDPTTDCFTFQTFDDVKERRDRRLARIFHGSVADRASELTSMNERGAGVFVCINATDLRGRGTNHVIRLRGTWQMTIMAGKVRFLSLHRSSSALLRKDFSGSGFAMA